ncbi:hypothetical protein JYT74_00115 [Crocinitomix catalasitica]|nr:hypothetical protein [Crocinitomix catalasitica]
MNRCLLILLFTSISCFGFSQAKTDIGFRYEIGWSQMASLQLRVPVYNRLKMNIAFGYEPNTRRISQSRNWSYILNQNDTLLTRRYWTYNRQVWQLQNGLTIQLPWKCFSVSFDFLISLERERNYNYNEYYLYDKTKSNYYELYTNESMSKQEGIQTKFSIVPGFRQAFHFHLPIGKRFVFGLSFAQMIGGTFIFRSEVEADPLQETWGNWLGIDEVRPDIRGVVSIRYRFGKEKSFDPIRKKKREKKLLPQ